MDFRFGRDCISDLAEEFRFGRESNSDLAENFSFGLESISEKYGFGFLRYLRNLVWE